MTRHSWKIRGIILQGMFLELCPFSTEAIACDRQASVPTTWSTLVFSEHLQGIVLVNYLLRGFIQYKK